MKDCPNCNGTGKIDPKDERIAELEAENRRLESENAALRVSKDSEYIKIWEHGHITFGDTTIQTDPLGVTMMGSISVGSGTIGIAPTPGPTMHDPDGKYAVGGIYHDPSGMAFRRARS